MDSYLFGEIKNEINTIDMTYQTTNNSIDDAALSKSLIYLEAMKVESHAKKIDNKTIKGLEILNKLIQHIIEYIEIESNKVIKLQQQEGIYSLINMKRILMTYCP